MKLPPDSHFTPFFLFQFDAFFSHLWICFARRCLSILFICVPFKAETFHYYFLFYFTRNSIYSIFHFQLCPIKILCFRALKKTQLLCLSLWNSIQLIITSLTASSLAILSRVEVATHDKFEIPLRNGSTAILHAGPRQYEIHIYSESTFSIAIRKNSISSKSKDKKNYNGIDLCTFLGRWFYLFGHSCLHECLMC